MYFICRLTKLKGQKTKTGVSKLTLALKISYQINHINYSQRCENTIEFKNEKLIRGHNVNFILKNLKSSYSIMENY